MGSYSRRPVKITFFNVTRPKGLGGPIPNAGLCQKHQILRDFAFIYSRSYCWKKLTNIFVLHINPCTKTALFCRWIYLNDQNLCIPTSSSFVYGAVPIGASIYVIGDLDTG